MKKAITIMLALALAIMPVSVQAKTTVDIDYINDKVIVKSTDFVKVGQYKIKTVWTTKKTRLYKNPKKGSEYAKTLDRGVALTRIMKGKTYSIIRYDGKGKGKKYYFVKNKNLSKKKPEMTPKAKYSASYFRRAGVIHWNGWRWTWYSEKVLPGGGLRIPGRHVDENRYVVDENGYICVSSSKLTRGTVIDTPFGRKGKVYDTGCARNTIDVYVSW